MRPRADFEIDFGLSGLTKFLRVGAVPRNAEGILAFITESLLANDGEDFAVEMVNDIHRLTQSTLSDDVLSILWLAATRAHFDPEADGIAIRAWLERIAEACLPFTGQDLPPELGMQDEDLRPDLQAAVLAELTGVSAALTEKAITSSYAPPLPTVVPALEAAIPVIGADLGFRLFLRAMKAYFVPIGPARMARFDEIGERLGYHLFVVDDGCLNVWSDLND
ncbi:hypothetical protein ACFV1L_24450 [Kitasatospora sp. NPDC059646]|uniref:hypothetical protein n=1 Tax=Kitasatospora sp. NPDC059646 TaxID=3346893 RepID=UPI0036AD3566